MIILNPYELFPVTASAPQTLLFVVADSGVPTANEAIVKALLEGLGWTVTYADEADALTGVTESLILVSDSITPGTLALKVRDFTGGLVIYDRGTVSENEFAANDAASMTALATTNIINTSHPITSVFSSGSLTLLDQTRAMADTLITDLGSGATVLADTPGNALRAMVYVYETAGSMDGAFSAPGRRVFLPLQGSTGDLLTDGETLLNRACLWAATIL